MEYKCEIVTENQILYFLDRYFFTFQNLYEIYLKFSLQKIFFIWGVPIIIIGPFLVPGQAILTLPNLTYSCANLVMKIVGIVAFNYKLHNI